MNEIQKLKEKIRNLKVIFVDDEEDIRVGTGAFLEKFFDDVVICSTPAELLARFEKKDKFDIVITDIMMPLMNGIEMTKEIKKIDPDIFIIFLTASREVDGFENSLSDITLQKPISFEDMKYIMQQLGKEKWSI